MLKKYTYIYIIITALNKNKKLYLNIYAYVSILPTQVIKMVEKNIRPAAFKCR